VAPRIFWKDHQHEFPALASLARDVLSIPATGAGVERLFNSARDICHYRRGSLNAKTIQDLMMFMCTSRFEIEEEQLAFVNEYLSNEEIQAGNEERDAQLPENGLDPISDDEEDDSVPEQAQLLTKAPSQHALGKRRRSVTSEPENEEGEAQELAVETDDEANLPLPAISPEEITAQMRTSRRVRKRSRREDDGFDYY
jgi:hypothetical protein